MTRSKKVSFSLVMVLAALGAYWFWFLRHPSYQPPPMAFSGDSADAKQTVVVPTLDTPMPKGKNVIWCGTIQLCWDGLKALPGLTLPTDTPACKRMSAASMNQADLPPGEFYTNAGWLRDGIVQKIRSDMAAKFPQHQPNLGPDDPRTEAIAYAYLKSQVKFTTPYFDRENGDEFTDSGGKKTRVRTFGTFHDSDAEINRTLAEQISVLFEEGRYPLTSFALDVDRNSRTSQLILARVEPGESLAATWKALKEKIQNLKPVDISDSRHFQLVVPDVNFRVNRRFSELEKGSISFAQQSIDFRLDKSGAIVGSEAAMHTQGLGFSFEFTGPFLIVMRKRGSEEPYFMMWVDNAELLCKQGD